ncbi:MAG: hypothetical protein WD118_05955 [Phycisphaeraceae bacterium]
MLALALALFTAFAYAELVTKYPKAAGAALYANRAFGRAGLLLLAGALLWVFTRKADA